VEHFSAITNILNVFNFQTLGSSDHFAVTSDVSSMASVRDSMKQESIL
jgi:hypothetical protein